MVYETKLPQPKYELPARQVHGFSHLGAHQRRGRAVQQRSTGRRCGRECIQHHGVRQMSPWILLLSDKTGTMHPQLDFDLLGAMLMPRMRLE